MTKHYLTISLVTVRPLIHVFDTLVITNCWVKSREVGWELSIKLGKSISIDLSP